MTKFRWSPAYILSKSSAPDSSTRLLASYISYEQGLVFHVNRFYKARLPLCICIQSSPPSKIEQPTRELELHNPNKSPLGHLLQYCANITKSEPLPFLILPDSPDGIWRWLFYHHPEHNGCCSRQGVPKRFCVSTLGTRQVVFGALCGSQVIAECITYQVKIYCV